MEPLLRGRRRTVPCTVEVEQTWESFHAHVDFKDDVPVEPGDAVRVLGEPIEVQFGDRVVLERVAEVQHAGLLERIWTKLTGRMELMELLEFSFTARRKL